MTKRRIKEFLIEPSAALETIEFPIGARILGVQPSVRSRDRISILAIVGPDEIGSTNRTFATYATCDPIADGIDERRYYGSCTVAASLWHVFEVL